MRVWEWLVPDRSTSDLVPGQVFSLLSSAAGTVETNPLLPGLQRSPEQKEWEAVLT